MKHYTNGAKNEKIKEMELGDSIGKLAASSIHTQCIYDIRDVTLSTIRTKVWNIIEEVWILRITTKWS